MKDPNKVGSLSFASYKSYKDVVLCCVEAE